MVKLPVELGDIEKQLTQENYDKIQIGMTEEQVFDTLGKVAITTDRKQGSKSLVYPFGVIEITDGKVSGKKP